MEAILETDEPTNVLLPALLGYVLLQWRVL